MRSLRTLQLLGNVPRTSRRSYRPVHTVLWHGYCSSCEAKKSTYTEQQEAASKASLSQAKKTSTTLPIARAVQNPPTPPADHRVLGTEQDLFTTSIYSPGSPLFLPNGAGIFNKLTAFLRAQYTYFGFDEVITPTIYKKSLWLKSGHWQNYAKDMFSVTGRGATGEEEGRQIGEDEEYGLKPMNCPGHCLLFASKPRSFRELPIRYSDFSPLHRNEISGSLSGLTRVRRFHQDDGHIFCRPSQVADEISKTLDFVRLTYQTFGLGPYRLALSTRPKDNFIGEEEEWDSAEAALRQALDASGQLWSVNEGDGAFYGPKIDIILKDSDGKEHQTATIQLDFQLPKRFELEYQAPAPEMEQRGLTTTDAELLATSGPVRPVMIHRAVLGSVERFMALLIEHYNGRWPFWLNPRQIIILTVTNDKPVVDFALKAMDEIQGGGLNSWLRRPSPGHSGLPTPDNNLRARERDRTTFAIDLDDSPRSLGKKIREAKSKRYGIIIVVGKSDVEKGDNVTVQFGGLLRHCDILNDEFGETDNPAQDISLPPQRLRDILLELERAYV
jgi:threonyl-tRNA synthetase